MMARNWSRFVLGGMVLLPFSPVHAQAAQLAVSDGGVKPAAVAELPDIPPAPTGKSTIMGGAIREVDPVRDQFTLHVYGIKPLKILFDARTQVFRDGKRIPLRDLGPASHASVQTTLDQGQVFALSVHIMSELPDGEFQGQVVSYNPENGQLVLSAAQGGQPFRLFVTKDTTFERQGQPGFASEQTGPTDLAPGSLVEIKFDAQTGKGTARQITVLATPGSTFVFSGNITALNIPAGHLVLVDPRYNMSYQITFDPHTGNASQLHVGEHVRVSADYDGHRYVATEVTPE
jgi:hypothetical protein